MDGINWTLQFFDYQDQPEAIQDVIRPFHHLAAIVAGGPQNLETLHSLRCLLLAKDAAVRAVVGRAVEE